jgi:hypothetical protein
VHQLELADKATVDASFQFWSSEAEWSIPVALAGGGVDIPLAAFGFEINETFRYQYNLFVPWEIDCRIESRRRVLVAEPLACLAARGDPADEDLDGPAAYPDWLEESGSHWARSAGVSGLISITGELLRVTDPAPDSAGRGLRC